VELEGRGPIVNTPPHLSWHPKGIGENDRFWFEGHEMVGYLAVRNPTFAMIYNISEGLSETNS
jgi:hypothetical protein